MVENIIEDQIIANTFIAEDPIKPRTIKINYIYFEYNALFRYKWIIF